MPSSASYADHRDLHSFPTRRSSDLPWGSVPTGIVVTLEKSSVRKTWTWFKPPTVTYANVPLEFRTIFTWFVIGPVARVFSTANGGRRSEEHTSELQSHHDLVCRLLLPTPTTEIFTLSLHDALPISHGAASRPGSSSPWRNRRCGRPGPGSSPRRSRTRTCRSNSARSSRGS